MPTFLTTPRMSPALRARVERAVSHRSRAKHHAARLGLSTPFASRERVRLARLLPALALAVVAILGFVMYRHGRRVVEIERVALLSELELRRAGLPPGHERFLGVTDHQITESAGDTAPPDTIAPALRAPGALDAWLKRPAVYLHGTSAELRDSAKLDDAARASIKDAFLLCLLAPPPSGSERDLLTKVRGVYFGGAKVDDQTANVRRLAEARIGLGVLGSAFESAALAAEDVPQLKKLRKDLDAAPIEEAKKAAAAELLIVVSDLTAPTNVREARVTLVDLTSKTAILRVRRRIEEQGKSSAASLYRDHLEGCALALAVRKSVDE